MLIKAAESDDMSCENVKRKRNEALARVGIEPWS